MLEKIDNFLLVLFLGHNAEPPTSTNAVTFAVIRPTSVVKVPFWIENFLCSFLLRNRWCVTFLNVDYSVIIFDPFSDFSEIYFW